jgi:hypothetical protein
MRVTCKGLRTGVMLAAIVRILVVADRSSGIQSLPLLSLRAPHAIKSGAVP